MKSRFIFFTSLLFVFGRLSVQACTNFIVTKGASYNNSVMITYAADSHTRYGAIAFYPSSDHKPGEMCEVNHYENGKLLGKIPEVPHTYSVIQFMNEHQVAIGETTFGGLDSLNHQPGAILDYGSLMKIGLQRAKTARELMKIITELVEIYGYASSGESFSISDANEAWIMEMIGKGKYEKGAVWVARLIPDGFVSGHANQARITTFQFQKSNNWNDPSQTTFHSSDVISFAKKHGYYNCSDESFSFSDVYNPINFGGARFCDARIWSFFRAINKELRENTEYTQYAQGQFVRNFKFNDGTSNPNAFVSNRLPLWVKPDSPITLKMVMEGMRNHYEETPLDMRNDPGAGPFNLPYRWRPMEFVVDSILYLNERAVATQQTGYSFIAQSRNWLPNPIGGIFWFGVDDADGCVYVPFYCGIQRIPESYAIGNGSMITWSETSAFWTFNQVNNWAYTRYNLIHPEIEDYQKNLENQFISECQIVDKCATEKYLDSQELGINYITTYSNYTGNKLISDWKTFYQYLFMKYMDGNVKHSQNGKLTDNGNNKNIPKPPTQPGYGHEWNKIMIQETGDRLKVIIAE